MLVEPVAGAGSLQDTMIPETLQPEVHSSCGVPHEPPPHMAPSRRDCLLTPMVQESQMEQQTRTNPGHLPQHSPSELNTAHTAAPASGNPTLKMLSVTSWLALSTRTSP